MLCGSVILCNPNYAMCLSDRLWETSGYRLEHSGATCDDYYDSDERSHYHYLLLQCRCAPSVRISDFYNTHGSWMENESMLLDLNLISS